MFQVIRTLNQKNYQLLASVWLLVITIVSGIPNLKLETAAGIPELDKFAHLIIFAMLAYLLAGSLHRYIRSWKPIPQLLLVFLLTFLFGCLDELHQSTVVGRSASLWDVLADGIGSLIGAMVYRKYQF